MLAVRTDWRGGSLITLHDLAGKAVTVPLALIGEPTGAVLVDLADPAERLKVGKGSAVDVPLDAYGARWFRLIGGTGRSVAGR